MDHFEVRDGSHVVKASRNAEGYKWECNLYVNAHTPQSEDITTIRGSFKIGRAHV